MTGKLQAILEAEGLASLLEKFNEQGVTDSILGDLTDSDLKELGVVKLGERKRLIAAFSGALPAVFRDEPEASQNIATTASDESDLPPLLRKQHQKFSAPPASPTRDMVTISAGTFTSEEMGLAEISVDEFLVGQYRVTFDEWAEVYEWGLDNGFKFASMQIFELELFVPDTGTDGRAFTDNEARELQKIYRNIKETLLSQGMTDSEAAESAFRKLLLEMGCGRKSGRFESATHINWYDAVAWCNAKSLKEHLEPVYLSGGSGSKACYNEHYSGDALHHPIAWNTGARGYRLLTANEWFYVASKGLPESGLNKDRDANLLGLFGMPSVKPFENEDVENISEWLWDCSVHHNDIGCDWRQTSLRLWGGVRVMTPTDFLWYSSGIRLAQTVSAKSNPRQSRGLFGFMKSTTDRSLVFH